jgi:hypothetical protein
LEKRVREIEQNLTIQSPCPFSKGNPENLKFQGFNFNEIITLCWRGFAIRALLAQW